MRRLRIDQDIRPMSEFGDGVASFIKQILSVEELKEALIKSKILEATL